MLVYQRVMGKFSPKCPDIKIILDIILELDELGGGCFHISIIYIYISIYLLILRYIKHFLNDISKFHKGFGCFFFASEVSDDP